MDAATYVLEDLPYELDDAAARRARLLPVAFVVVAALVLGAAGAWMLADLRADAGDQADELRLLQETLRSTTDELVATKADVQRLMGQLSAARGDAPAPAAATDVQADLDTLRASLDSLTETVGEWRGDRKYFDEQIAQIDGCLENLRLRADEVGDGFELTC